MRVASLLALVLVVACGFASPGDLLLCPDLFTVCFDLVFGGFVVVVRAGLRWLVVLVLVHDCCVGCCLRFSWVLGVCGSGLWCLIILVWGGIWLSLGLSFWCFLVVLICVLIVCCGFGFRVLLGGFVVDYFRLCVLVEFGLCEVVQYRLLGVGLWCASVWWLGTFLGVGF